MRPTTFRSSLARPAVLRVAPLGFVAAVATHPARPRSGTRPARTRRWRRRCRHRRHRAGSSAGARRSQEDRSPQKVALAGLSLQGESAARQGRAVVQALPSHAIALGNPSDVTPVLGFGPKPGPRQKHSGSSEAARSHSLPGDPGVRSDLREMTHPPGARGRPCCLRGRRRTHVEPGRANCDNFAMPCRGRKRPSSEGVLYQRRPWWGCSHTGSPGCRAKP